MNKVLLQLWEESTIDNYVSDGCSIHLNKDEYIKYVENIYSKRNNNITPSNFECVVGDSIYVFIEDNLFEMLKNVKNIRLSQIEMRNLINIEEIILKK
jgi:hypothetical protein